MTTPKGYVDAAYLAVAARLVQKNKQRSYEYLNAHAGQALLDVGCGPASDTLALAGLVGPSGRVVGVDYDPAMVAEANRRAEQAGLSATVQHKQADVTALPFPADEFNASRSERMFQHLLDPVAALAEMVRVTRPGGWVVVLDTDWSSISIDTPEFDIERRLMRVMPEHALHNGYVARQLYRLFKQCQLAEIAVDNLTSYVTRYSLARQLLLLDKIEPMALAAGLVTEDELRRWRASQEAADAQGVYFSSGSMLLVAGRKV